MTEQETRIANALLADIEVKQKAASEHRDSGSGTIEELAMRKEVDGAVYSALKRYDTFIGSIAKQVETEHYYSRRNKEES